MNKWLTLMNKYDKDGWEIDLFKPGYIQFTKEGWIHEYDLEKGTCVVIDGNWTVNIKVETSE